MLQRDKALSKEAVKDKDAKWEGINETSTKHYWQQEGCKCKM